MECGGKEIHGYATIWIEKGLKPKSPKCSNEMKLKVRALEKQLKEKNKEIEIQKYFLSIMVNTDDDPILMAYSIEINLNTGEVTTAK